MAFPSISLAGDAIAIGQQHGQQLAQRIRLTLDYYQRLFALDDARVFSLARHFEQLIGDTFPAYLSEIRALAEAAAVDPLWIIALNSRTEILSLQNIPAQECSTLAWPTQRLLAQNWDWGQTMEALCVVMHITGPDNHRIRMLCEPGMLGKIGINSAGLGVCLNILNTHSAQRGLPVHIILRALLDCRSYDEALALVKQHGLGKASNVMVMDKHGRAFNCEFAGAQQYIIESTEQELLHTNHYLGASINNLHDPIFASSTTRLERLRVLHTEYAKSPQNMLEILSDSEQPLPIFRDYIDEPQLGKLGTVATIIMDMSTLSLRVRQGADAAAELVAYPV